MYASNCYGINCIGHDPANGMAREIPSRIRGPPGGPVLLYMQR